MCVCVCGSPSCRQHWNWMASQFGTDRNNSERNPWRTAVFILFLVFSFVFCFRRSTRRYISLYQIRNFTKNRVNGKRYTPSFGICFSRLQWMRRRNWMFFRFFFLFVSSTFINRIKNVHWSVWRTLLHVPACLYFGAAISVFPYVVRAPCMRPTDRPHEEWMWCGVQCACRGGGSLQKCSLHILDTQRASRIANVR